MPQHTEEAREGIKLQTGRCSHCLIACLTESHFLPGVERISKYTVSAATLL